MSNIDRRRFLGSLGVAAAMGGGLRSLADGPAMRLPAAAQAPADGVITLLPSGQDDTAALQAAIEQCFKTKSRLQLGQGLFSISKTLEINKCINFSLAGMGAANPSAKNGWAESGRALGTYIKWTGPAGGTMMMLKGAFWPVLTGLYLDAANAAAVCIQLTTVDSWGLPTSGVRLRDVRVAQATQAGIQFDTPPHPNGWNTDLSDFDSVILDRCAVGIRVCNNQSVGHYWRRIANGCPIGIEFLQGGDVVIERGWQDGPGRADDTFFLTHGGGENAAQVQIGGIHLEHGMLLDSRKSFGVVVAGIRGIQDCRSDTDAPPLCHFGHFTTATVMASQLKGALVAKPESRVAIIGCTYVTASVSHPVRKLVRGTKKVQVI